jgi:hypothetical protein
MPRHVFASYKGARTADFIQMPVAFVGTFERVSSEPFRNVHGHEWGVIFRVKKVYFDSWHDETFSFNISSPEQKWFAAGEDYYVIALHTRHGFYLHDTFPAAEKPNKSPEPTLTVRPFSFMTAALETPSSLWVSAAHL